LIEACRTIGRDPAEIRWSGQVEWDGTNPEATVVELGHWWDAGFSELILNCRGADPVRLAEVATETILPRMRDVSSAV
jgi:hypothetical protein